MKHDKLEWMSVHFATMLSKDEKIAKEKSSQDRGTLVNLKQSIAVIFLKWAGAVKGFEKERFTHFGLYSPPPEGVGNSTLIFVNDLRLDLASHTIVADACSVPLTEQNIDKLEPALGRLSRRGIIQVVTLDDEIRLWKYLLPALAERCRTWKHLSTCEYLFKGIPACMDGFDESPLCSCGKGKDLGNFGTKSEWKEFHSEATRIALSPLFSTTWMETPKAAMKTELKKANIGTSSSSSSISPPASKSLPQCANCSGPGHPTLLSCSVCKHTKYCSRACQKSHWKTHKLQCSASSGQNPKKKTECDLL